MTWVDQIRLEVVRCVVKMGTQRAWIEEHLEELYIVGVFGKQTSLRMLP